MGGSKKCMMRVDLYASLSDLKTRLPRMQLQTLQMLWVLSITRALTMWSGAKMIIVRFSARYQMRLSTCSHMMLFANVLLEVHKKCVAANDDFCAARKHAYCAEVRLLV